MSEKAPQPTAEAPKSGYNPDSNASYKDYLMNGGEIGQTLREKAAAESSPEEPAVNSYRDDLMNRVGNYRTDGPLLDESERARRFITGGASSEDDKAAVNDQEVNDSPKETSEDVERTRVLESVDKGDVVRFRNKDDELEEWQVKHIGNADKDGNKGVLLEKTDGSGDEHVRFYEGLLDAIEEGPVQDSLEAGSDQNDKSHEKVADSDDKKDSPEEKPPLNSKNLVEELVQTTDPEEARAYWEANVKDSGVTLEAFMAQGVEGSWLVKRLVEKNDTDPKDQDDEEEPSDEDKPTVPVPVVDPTPPEDGGSEKTPVKPEKKRTPGRMRKFGRACLAALALLPGAGYIAGRVHENYIIKSHDIPAVDEINKFQDHVRQAPEDVQENIANNFSKARAFFDSETGVGTEQGAENFGAMQDAVQEEIAKLKEQHGSSLSDKRAEELAKAKIKARLQALEIASLENEITQ